ncbi:MAG: superoxide dismutase [Fe] [Candidatus Schekmanbacteria bacterium]|nr:superoxide dismutase [Fe] [Candidatus Schekmanbacteria bacterium]
MAFELPVLPYAKDALQPHLSAETLEYHYGKHHQAYVNNLNNLVAGAALEKKKLDELIVETEGGIFNNAAQTFNHTFYWSCMRPGGGGLPSGDLAEAIDRYFGSFAKFREELSTAATTLFGSGWAWLVKDGQDLSIMNTGNADLPQKHGKKPLLTIDVWEHAYYIDYRNARPNYIKTFMDHLVNWDFVASNLR